MKDVLADIQSGGLREPLDRRPGRRRRGVRRLREQDRNHQIEQVGADLRAKMPFLKPVVVDAGQAQAVASSGPAESSAMTFEATHPRSAAGVAAGGRPDLRHHPARR